MSRSLSWIESSELSALFSGVSEPQSTGQKPATLGAGTYSHRPASRTPSRPAPASSPAARAGSDRRTPASAGPPAAARPAPARPAATRSVPRPGERRDSGPHAAPAGAPPRPATRPGPATARPASPPAATIPGRPATRSPAPPAHDQDPIAPFRPPPGADIATRLSHYIDWALDALGVYGIAIVDAEGLVVAQRQVGDVDAIVATGVESFLDYIRDLFADDPGAGTIARHKTNGDAGPPADQVEGFVALRYGERHLGAVWAQTNFGRLYGVLLARSAPAQGALVRAGEGLRALFAD